MELIAHRRNTIAQLNDTPHAYGVEMDIRSDGGKLIIHHDPFATEGDFEAWLKHYKHGTLILNVKEEGLEPRVLELMERYGIEQYFFLDQSFPFLVKWSKLGLNRAAVRVSEYESIETAMTLAGKVDWVWVDCFTHLALTGEQAKRLQGAGFKLCLVSPELQGRDAETEIPQMRQLLLQRGIRVEAVCTKRPELWATHAAEQAA